MSFNKSSTFAAVLNAENIDILSEKCTEFCESLKIENKQVQRIRLTLEECLLTWKDRFNNELPMTLKYGFSFGKPFMIIDLKSDEAFNPFEDEIKEDGSYSRSLLVNLGLSPEYSYRNGSNLLHFRLQKPPANQLKVLGLVILASVAVGVLGVLLIPPQLIETILENWLNPVCDKFFSVLSCIAGPMIFLSVAWGIYGIGDTATLNKIGKRMIFRYIGIVFLIAAVGTVAFPVLGPGLSSSSSGGFALNSVFQMFLDIIPDNIFSPFIDCNTLQIIFLAVVVGIVLLFLEKQTSAVAIAIEQINNMVQFMMMVISKLVPFFIFIVLVQMIWSGEIKVILSIIKLAIVVVVCFALIGISVTVIVGARRKVSPVVLFKKGLPTFLIAISTASSAASFGTIMQCCTKKFGIQENVSSFGIPLGFVMSKPHTALYYLLLSFYFAGVYNLDCSLGWIVIGVFMAGMLSMATPSIPGGSTAAYTLLFVQMGIPASALTIALAVDILFDFLMTAGDMYTLPLILADFTADINKIDLETFRKNEE